MLAPIPAMQNHIKMAIDDRTERLLGHSGLGYGTNVTRFLSREELGAYKNTCTSCNKAVNHLINAHNFLEIIYVYKKFVKSQL